MFSVGSNEDLLDEKEQKGDPLEAGNIQERNDQVHAAEGLGGGKHRSNLADKQEVEA